MSLQSPRHRRIGFFKDGVSNGYFSILLLFAVALFFAGVEPVSSQTLFSPTQDPLAGSRVFGIKACSKCHAIDGVGGKIGPDLGRIPRPRSFYDLAAAMWNHLPQMGQQMQKLGITRPQLSPTEAGDLIAFLYTINYFDRPGDLEAGRRIFATKGCVVCHQVNGSGGVIGPNLENLTQQGSPIYIAAAMLSHGPSMTEAMKAKGIQRPTFSGSELKDLIAYIKSGNAGQGREQIYFLPGRPDRGQEIFAARRCNECHSVKGRGGKVGGDLAERRLQSSLLEFAAAMWNKSPLMVKEMKERNIPVPQLRAEEMADVVAYLYSVQYFARPGNAHRGEALARTKNCLGCHSINGKGAKVGPDFRKMHGLDQPVTVVSAMWNHASTMEEKMAQMSLRWPALKGEEMADLVALIQSVESTR